MENNNQLQSTYLKRWTTDISKSNLIFCFSSLFLFVGLESALKNKIDKYIINDVASKFPQNSIPFNLLFTSLIIITAVTLFRRIEKKLIPTFNSTILFATITILYLVYYRIGKGDTFYNFWNIECIKYLDCLLIISFIHFASYKSYNEALLKANSSKFLLEDSPDENLADDFQTRERYAKYINDNINATTTTKSSFAISIVGEWGSGKSDFILRLEKLLKKNDNENIVFRFNPWRVSNPNAITEEFFQTLATQLKPYSRSIIQQVKDYSKSLLQTDKEVKYRLINSLIHTWYPDKNIEQKFIDIQNTISSTGKRVIIFIDDLDRLTGKEVVDVFRMIRNSANFLNTFFIVSIDETYIVNVLKQTKELDNEEEYLKKIFQLHITLPSFKKTVLKIKLKEYLLTDDVSQNHKVQLENVIDKLSTKENESFFNYNGQGLLEEMIDNLRDLKSFANSFKIAFEILKDESDLYDLMVLELIKNRNIKIYRDIQNKSLLSTNQNYFNYNFAEGIWANNITNKKYAGNCLEVRSAIETYLLKDESYKSLRKFTNVHNFYIYFSYHLFNLISLKEFNETLLMDKDSIVKKFQEWINKGYESELVEITRHLEIFSDKKSLYEINYIYLKLVTRDSVKFNWFNLVKLLLEEKKEFNFKNYFNSDKEEYKAFLKQYFDDPSISYYNRASIAYAFLYQLIKDKSIEQYSFTKKEYQKIILDLFFEYITSEPTDIKEIFDFFWINIYAIDNKNYIVFHRCAIRMLREYMLSKPNLFEMFTRNIMRPDPRSVDDSMFTFSIILRTLFNDINLYKSMLIQKVFKTPEVENLKKIILQHINNEVDNSERVMKSFQINNIEERALIISLNTVDRF